MATSSIHYITDYRQWRCFVTASISSQDDDYAWISWSWGAEMKWAYLYGIAGKCTVDGSQVSSQAATNASESQYDSSGNWFTVFSHSGTTKVAKCKDAKTVTIATNCWGETTSDGIGSAGGNLSTSVTVTVPSRTYRAHGNPTLTVNKSTVKHGESATFTFAKSSTQGNASFSRFELWCGSTKLYSGTGTSYSCVPGDQVAITDRQATFVLKEIHDWYGTEKTTSTSFTVSIQRGVITHYDGSQAKHQALVHFYDSSGQLHSCLVFAYNGSGNLRNAT